jgi:hypothetical protein
MNVRKQRTHYCGLANIDFRTKGDMESNDRYNPSLKFSDFGTMTKSKLGRTSSSMNPVESLRTNNGWQFPKRPDPKTDTATAFYMEAGKNAKFPVLVASGSKTQHLEKEQWTDKVFTGDNVAVTAKLAGDAASRDWHMKFKGKRATHDLGHALHHKFTQLAQLLMQERK